MLGPSGAYHARDNTAAYPTRDHHIIVHPSASFH